MKCFLHIGTEKTATTTIQNFLNLNRDILLNDKIIYTKTAGKTNNRALPVAAYNLNRRDDYTKIHGIKSESELLDFQKKIAHDLKTEITKTSRNDSEFKIIFSSEHFQSRLTTLEEIKRLKNIIDSFGINEIYVIIYLRGPAEIANSLYSTAIKSGSQGKHPPSPKNLYWNNVCNHKNTLEKFGSVFGTSALIPRLFYPKEFLNGSIIDDFLNAIGVSDTSSYEIPPNSNESLSVVGVNLLRRLNHIVPMWIDNKPNPVRLNLVSYIEKYFSDSKYVMPRELFEKYDLEFSESNEWVRRKFFPHKKKLFSEYYQKESKLEISDTDLDRIANLIGNIWNDKYIK